MTNATLTETRTSPGPATVIDGVMATPPAAAHPARAPSVAEFVPAVHRLADVQLRTTGGE